MENELCFVREDIDDDGKVVYYKGVYFSLELYPQ